MNLTIKIEEFAIELIGIRVTTDQVTKSIGYLGRNINKMKMIPPGDQDSILNVVVSTTFIITKISDVFLDINVLIFNLDSFNVCTRSTYWVLIVMMVALWLMIINHVIIFSITNEWVQSTKGKHKLKGSVLTVYLTIKVMKKQAKSEQMQM